MRALALPVTLLLVLVAVAPAAAETPLANLSSPTILWTGEAQVAGGLRAWRSSPTAPTVQDPSPVGSAPRSTQVGPVAMRISADSAHIWLDHFDSNVSLASTEYGNAWSEELSLAAVQGEFMAAGQDVAFFVAPAVGTAAQVLLHSDGGSLGAQAPDSVAGQQRVPSPQPAPQASTSNSARLPADDGWQTLRITGDLRVMVWDWDSRLVSEGRSHALPSGTKSRDLAPGPAGPAVQERRSTQVYMDLRNATLEATFAPGTTAELMLDPSTLRLDGRLALEQAAGTLQTQGGTQALEDRPRVQVEGRLQGSFGAPVGGRVPIALFGEADRVQVNDEILSFVAPRPTGPLSSWALALTTGVLAAALAAAVVLRLRHTSSLRRDCELWMEREEYQRVAEAAPRLLRSRRGRADALVMSMVALLRLGRLDEAQALGARYGGRDAPAGAEYVAAHIHAVRKDWVAARTALQACLAKEPDMREEVAANPVFFPLLRSLGLVAPPHASEGYG